MEKLIIDKDLTELTLNWTLNKKNRDNYLNPDGDKARFHNFSKDEEEFINSLGLNYTSIEIIGQIILSHYGLDLETTLNPYYNYNISWYSNGYEEKPSRSDNLKGKVAVRFNVMLQKPISEKEIEDNEVWMEVRGISRYGISKIKGRRNMVLVSMEYHVDEDIAKEKGWLHSDCKAIESSPVWNKNNNYNEDKYYPYIGDKPKIDTTKINHELEEVKQLEIIKLQEELYSDSIDIIRENHIRKKLSYAPK
tara:strand:+ start:1496 stop:2245 length:750 start_codon:yes stop_codon:yes gene_type:complete